ncbi:DUF4145 domain-containing protein [Ligilactobacillus acidipiscis]|nr:DUF4145 domain-containing protein [Ligilactobacillus acidipiscis]
MERNINVKHAQSTNSSSITLDIDEYCPHCKNSVSPHIIYAVTSKPIQRDSFNSIAIFLQCPRSVCSKFYSLEYPCSVSQYSAIDKIKNSIKYTYSPHLENTLPENLKATFPDFIKIYEQSLEAESMGLDEIAGVGYRKSIEFLIKSYVIREHPDKKDQVESMFLGNVIKDDLTDIPRVQSLAQAAVWIGNDETHFTRIHDDKDIRDMKSFLEAAALFISANLKADEAAEFTASPES